MRENKTEEERKREKYREKERKREERREKEREKERENERKRERKERKREKKREKEIKRCPGSIIINLHSIRKKTKTMYIGRNAQNLKKLPGPVLDHYSYYPYKSSCRS